MNIRERQAPLRDRYKADPASAPIVLRVRSAPSDLADPLHCTVRPDSVSALLWASGAHEAVGGAGDVPCSADLLLGALVACQETTLRMVAANIGVTLQAVEIEAEADWDPRGTLAMGDFPIGLTGIRVRTSIAVSGDVNPDRAARLLRSAEKYCVVLNTLRHGVAVESTFEMKEGNDGKHE